MQRKPVSEMLDAIEKLQVVNTRNRKSVSNSQMLLANFKNLRSAYHLLDPETKTLIDNFMQKDHRDLLAVLQKNGSQITNIPDLGCMIDNAILVELQNLLQAAPAYQLENADTHTTVMRKLSDEALPDTGTVKFTASEKSDPQSPSQQRRNQLQFAVNSPNLKKVSSSYLAHSTYGSLGVVKKEDSLTIIIESFEIILKTKEIRLKQNGELTTSYLDAYKLTMQREVNTLRAKIHMQTLGDLVSVLTEYPELDEIYHELSAHEPDNDKEDEPLKTAEKIANLLNDLLIAVLQKTKLSRQENRLTRP